MRILSWNVNGIRAAAKKGFLDWLAASGGDIVGVQETKAWPEQLGQGILEPAGWKVHWSSAQRKGYSGVALFVREGLEPLEVETCAEVKAFGQEGRIQLARFGQLLLANVYFPNGSGRDRDNSRVPFKLKFYRSLFDLLENERAAGGRILVMGDFNTAHRQIDLARPRANRKTSGFLDSERRELGRWLNSGWTDTFRHFRGDIRDHYTWWSQRSGVRDKNIGWRLDLVLASPGALPYLHDAIHLPEVLGSDHCPVGVEVYPAILH
jgi:exodeoxyribonuclease-3